MLTREEDVDGLHRILAKGFGYSDAEITGFLDTIDTDDSATRTFVFAISTGPTASAATARSRTAGSTTSPSATSSRDRFSAPTTRPTTTDPH
ncbi:hypothetical protein [Streptomyces sp. NPDC046862]|uniref:hypothetical protein n=1 Tax=Streptomyces sp. NPDC046862 TaxID=3154603 RepID=UPI003453D350